MTEWEALAKIAMGRVKRIEEAEKYAGLSVPSFATPEAVTAEAEAENELVSMIRAKRHYVNDDDPLFNCHAATPERDGGEAAYPQNRGKPCTCGRDNWVQAALHWIAKKYE